MTTLQEQARALGDPTRHQVLRYLADAAGPVDLSELTQHCTAAEPRESDRPGGPLGTARNLQLRVGTGASTTPEPE